MLNTPEGTISQEATESLQESFRSLNPVDKASAVQKAVQSASVEIGFRTTEPGLFAIPVEDVLKHLPKRLGLDVIKVLPTPDREFTNIPSDIVPTNPCPSVEWYQFVDACLCAIPKGEMKSDLTAFIEAQSGSESQELVQAALQSIATIAEKVKDVPQDGALHVAVGQKLIWDFLERTSEKSKQSPNFSTVMYSLNHFMTGYLADIDQQNHVFTVRSDRLDSIK